jgi:hypothetical protein
MLKVGKIEASIKIHFDGEIAEGNQIPVRALAMSLLHIQRAIDRAYLDIKYDGVWKHARMKDEDYEITEFLTKVSIKGGYIQELFSSVKKSANVVDRVSGAINEVTLQSTIRIDYIKDKIVSLKRRLANKQVEPVTFREFSNDPGKEVVRAYGDRSIAKEIDQVLSTLRHDNAGESRLNLAFTGTSKKEFEFNRFLSQKFHEAVAKKSLSKPIVYKGKLKALDKNNLKGKFENTETGGQSNLHFIDNDDFITAHPYLASEEEMIFVGSALIEFGSIEPNSGDVYFLRLLMN